MHSCIQTSSIQIDSKCMQTFSAQSWTPHCHQDMSEKCSRLRIYLQIFMVTIKQIPTDTSLTASTNVISMPYPNTIPNTKMTLPQLVGPIDVVSPEHSSGDRVTNSKLLPQRMPALNSPKQNMHAPPKQNSHTVPLHLVHPNMHKARSFPRSPAKNTGYFHTPFRGKLRPSMASFERIPIQS